MRMATLTGTIIATGTVMAMGTGMTTTTAMITNTRMRTVRTAARAPRRRRLGPRRPWTFPPA